MRFGWGICDFGFLRVDFMQNGWCYGCRLDDVVKYHEGSPGRLAQVHKGKGVRKKERSRCSGSDQGVSRKESISVSACDI